MSFETLLTLAVAVGLLVLGAVLRLVFMGSVGLVRTLRGDSGRPSRSRTVAPRSWSERGKRILDGASALSVFAVASVAGLFRGTHES